MADPITWGLINLVRKGIKSVQTAIDGVGDTVNNLPSSLETDFTEVKNAIAGVKTDVGNVNTAVGNVNTAVSGVKSDTSSIKNTVDTNPLLAAGSAVKSVQRGSFYQRGPSITTYPININSVNANKSILLINNEFHGDSTDNTLYETSITLSSNGNIINAQSKFSGGYFSFDWQVIEFY